MSDTTAPVLRRLFLPDVIDLAFGNTSFTVGVQVEDEPGGSGVRWATVEFKDAYRTGGYKGSNKYAFVDDQWSRDNFHDATPNLAFQTLQISDLSRSGTYEVARVVLTDWAGNTATYETAQLRALGFPAAIEVRNGLVDKAAPTLLGLEMPSSFDLSTGFAQNFEVEARARDNGGASVHALTISFDKPLDLGSGPTTELRLTTDTRVEDFVHAQLRAVPALWGKTAPGIYTITNIRVSDFQDNVRDYSTAQLQALGIGTALTVAGHAVEHPAVPPAAAVSWSMGAQGVVMSVMPETWGDKPVDMFALRIQRNAGVDRLEGIALLGGARAEFSVVEDDYTITVVGRNASGIGTGTGLALSMAAVQPGTKLDLRFAGFTVNGVTYGERGSGAPVEYYRGTDAADRIEYWHLPDLVDGGSGPDTLLVHRSRLDYDIGKSGDGFVLHARLSGDATRVVNVERIVFDDGGVALDTGGAPGQLYRLYQAAFDRAPDPGGFGHWLRRMEAGDSLERIAGYFVASKEFVDLTGAAATDRAFVTALYDNVLQRQPDATGLEFWTGVLGRGALDRQQVLVEFSESPENVARLVGALEHGIDYTLG